MPRGGPDIGALLKPDEVREWRSLTVENPKSKPTAEEAAALKEKKAKEKKGKALVEWAKYFQNNPMLTCQPLHAVRAHGCSVSISSRKSINESPVFYEREVLCQDFRDAPRIQRQD